MIDPAIVKKRGEADQRVVSALRFVGTRVDSVYDLLDRQVTQNEIEALLKVLPTVDEPVIKEGVVRALTVRAARGVAAKPLVAELRRAADNGEDLLAWAIGNALMVVADESVRSDLLELARDSRLGGGRETVVMALARLKKDEEVIATLLDNLKDEEVAGHALVALRKLKAVEAMPQVEQFLDHPKAWVRKEAKKTIRAFQKIQDAAPS